MKPRVMSGCYETAGKSPKFTDGLKLADIQELPGTTRLGPGKQSLIALNPSDRKLHC